VVGPGTPGWRHCLLALSTPGGVGWVQKVHRVPSALTTLPAPPFLSDRGRGQSSPDRAPGPYVNTHVHTIVRLYYVCKCGMYVRNARTRPCE
jgi:hypothetical protein